jgi:hypothetical protein
MGRNMRKTLTKIAGLLAAVPVLNATPRINARVVSAFRALPACVATVAVDQTRGIEITDSNDILGSAYDGAVSDDGLIILSRSAVDKWLILHELGHQVAGKFDLTYGRFVRALRADFHSLDTRERESLAYFRDPNEAFAELFAALYDPEDIAAKNPRIVRLVRARAVETSMLDSLEGCGGGN